MNSRWRNLILWVFSYLSFLLASMNEKFTCMKALISKGCIFISFVSFPCNGEQSPEEGNLRVRCAPLSLLQLQWETNRMVDTCLAPRRLSLSMKMCAQRKAGRRQRARRRFAGRLYPSHGPLRFITSHSCFALASTTRKTKRLRRRLGRHIISW